MYESAANHCTKILWYEKKIKKLDRSISKTKTYNLHSVLKKFSKENKKAFARKLSNNYNKHHFRFFQVKAKKVTPRLFSNWLPLISVPKNVLRIDKRISRFVRSSQSSRRIRKFYTRRRKFYHRIKCIREYYLHQVSNSIVKPVYEITEEEKNFVN